MVTKAFQIDLRCGLCNMLFAISAACKVAKQHAMPFEEPDLQPPWIPSLFDVREKTKFGKMYDIDFFNMMMASYTGLTRTMIPSGQADTKMGLFRFGQLWDISERFLATIRDARQVPADHMRLLLCKSLRLMPSLSKHIPSNIRSSTAVHFRIEDDWREYCDKAAWRRPNLRFFDASQIAASIPRESTSIYYTCGSRHHEVEAALSERGLTDFSHFYDKSLTYTENSAVNLEACMRAKIFIGHSNSTFTNFVRTWRALSRQQDTYIYNLSGMLNQTQDCGLFRDAAKAATEKVVIIPLPRTTK